MVLVDHIVMNTDQRPTTRTTLILPMSGEITRPADSFKLTDWTPEKVIARRAAMELEKWRGGESGLRHLSNIRSASCSKKA